MNSLSKRAVAARVFSDIIFHRKPFQGPEDPRLKTLTPENRSFVSALIWGTCRYWPRYERFLSFLLEKPLKEGEIVALIALGWFQLDAMRAPDYAVVQETVEAAKKLKKPWGCGVVNALLRQMPRVEDFPKDLTIQYAAPHWLFKMLQQDWPDKWQAILEAQQAHPPMTLRVNPKKMSVIEYQALLEKNAMSVRSMPGAPNFALTLEEPVPVTQLPLWKEGVVSVQDGASQRISSLISYNPHLRILDACAAPGGKAISILEQATVPVHLTALEKDSFRYQKLCDNVKQSGFEIECRQADAIDTESWWDGVPYDIVLLDAPCSATGVIRRHSDIQCIRTAAEVAHSVEEQKRLLKALWACVKPGGFLLYCTCSVLMSENEHQIQEFLKNTPDAVVDSMLLPWHKLEHGYQNLPGEHGEDGFYIAKIIKR